MGAALRKAELPQSREESERRDDFSVRRRDASVHRSYEGSVHSTRTTDPVVLEMLESLVSPEDDELGYIENPLGVELAQAHKEEQRDLPAAELGSSSQQQPNILAERGSPDGVEYRSSSPDPIVPVAWRQKTLLQHIKDYFMRMRGGVEKPAKFASFLDISLGFLGAFTSIFIIAVLRKWVTPDSHFDFLVASFGASAVLVFGVAEGKLSQPRNLIGGQVISAIVGCTVRLVLKDVIYVGSALGMALALSAMQATKTLHPPGGATALIAASAPDPLPRGAGYSIVLVVLIDACIMLIIGLLVNNAQPHKRYPTFWF